MMEALLLVLLSLGGGHGSPAASPAMAAASLAGVWRGTWSPAAGDAMPVEAVLAPGRDAGSLVAVLVTGRGRGRRSGRLAGQLVADGLLLSVPSGGAIRLSATDGLRLVGRVTGPLAGGLLPGDGALELARVRR